METLTLTLDVTVLRIVLVIVMLLISIELLRIYKQQDRTYKRNIAELERFNGRLITQKNELSDECQRLRSELYKLRQIERQRQLEEIEMEEANDAEYVKWVEQFGNPAGGASA